jgi:hypothetical protein
LGLRWQNVDRFTLADGSECIFDVYAAAAAELDRSLSQ